MSTTTRTSDVPSATGVVSGSSRLASIDVSRGLVVVMSIIVTQLPADPSYPFTRHAEWFGLTVTDLIFPLFVGLFGVGLSFAHRNGIDWSRTWQRSWRLVLLGLAFNAVVEWDLAVSTWRLTGVLQLFAGAGMVVTAVVAVVGLRWWRVLLAGLGVLVGVQVLFSLWAAGCVDGVLVPGCNPSATIDPAVFTDPHIYVGGTRGHDPEGLTVIVSAAGTALLGVAAGSILGRWRTGGAAPRLLALAGGLGAMALVVDVFVMPVSKRLWTPSFALLAGACTALLLAVTHVLVDRRPAGRPSTARAVSGWSEWLVAFGRNSLLIYFGRYVVDSVLANVSLGRLTDGVAVRLWTIDWIRSWSPVPPVTWLVVMLAGWTLVAVTLHRRRRYIRV